LSHEQIYVKDYYTIFNLKLKTNLFIRCLSNFFLINTRLLIYFKFLTTSYPNTPQEA